MSEAKKNTDRPRLRDRAYSPDGVVKWTVFKRYNVWWVFAPGPLGGVINERDTHYKTYEKALKYVVSALDRGYSAISD